MAERRFTRFCFAIKSIVPSYEIRPPRSQPPEFYWEPPIFKADFVTSDNTGWYYQFEGSARPVPLHQQDILSCSTTSMFWCHDRQAFLQVPYDCTEVDVGQAPRGAVEGFPLDWKRLTFHSKPSTPPDNLSLVGYNYGRNELCGKGVPSWMPKILPEVYRHRDALLGQDRCLLAGNLSIIVGLTAFSAVPAYLKEAVGDSLRLSGTETRWLSEHCTGTGSKRTLCPHWSRVLMIYRDAIPWSCHTSRRQLLHHDTRGVENMGRRRMGLHRTLNTVLRQGVGELTA